jgi:RsiW-degrading membrane proteinase PrsW (M82 family)
LMLINATFFHVLPILRTHGRFSPGLFTAVVLFYPIGIACYWRSAADGALSSSALVGSLIIGALLMGSPIVLLKIKDRRYFRQDH